ncbi:MAG TPA: tRNA 2-selenouridine(34) synthase MnmH [Casimicrobiaceae bacterium]|nr:tRNA 2-selenouridine(34) synthase MnmH [Casimicrobiaceae bacterium]
MSGGSAPFTGVRRVGVAALGDYPDRIDVRSPAEFAVDHLPGAVNHPVLDDGERARVGTLYAASAFDARKLGAAIVARNIASMVESAFIDRPREWRPLVYCWRGGQRSRALGLVLHEIGWRAVQLEGGYRAYRRHVVAELTQAPRRFRYAVICGLTGSGKSRLIAALAGAGAQTLDLEGIARHRGSLLGGLPGEVQPSQKHFESALLDALSRLDASRPVFVESESRRIGAVQMPDALLEAMRLGRTLTLWTPREQRVALLKEEYGHFLTAPGALGLCLGPLVELHGKAKIARWEAMAAGADWDALIAELLDVHYDPIYARSLARNFAERTSHAIEAKSVTPAAFDALARELRAAIEDDASLETR